MGGVSVYVDDLLGMGYGSGARRSRSRAGRLYDRGWSALRAGRPGMAMITEASTAEALATEAEGTAFAREVLRIEAEALSRVRDRLDGAIARAAGRIQRCEGSVIVTGMG